MAVDGNALTTAANFKTANSISGSGEDTLIETLINRATSMIESLCDRKLKARNYNGFGTAFEHKNTSTGDTVISEDYIKFNGQKAIVDSDFLGRFYLPQYPIVPPSSVSGGHTNALTLILQRLTDRGSAVSGNESWETLDEFDDYIIDYENGYIQLLSGTFLHGNKNYRIKCTAGYTTIGSATQPYVPRDLEELCLYLAGRLYKEDLNTTSEKIGTWSRTYASGAEKSLFTTDPIVSAGLAKYTRLSIS